MLAIDQHPIEAEPAGHLDELRARVQAAREEAARLRAELAAEKAAHGQLAERIKAIRAKQDETVAQLEARVGRLQARGARVASVTEMSDPVTGCGTG